jgi:hypothetical protein
MGCVDELGVHAVLHITNGDAAAGQIRSIHPGEAELPWRDVLHEGPVPAGLDLRELSAIRAAFITARGWAPAKTVVESFRQRDEELARSAEHDEIVLWFDDDLYDQLQLIQVLAWCGEQSGIGGRLSLIEMLSAPTEDHFAERRPVRREQIKAASQAWAAFRAPDPSALAKLSAHPIKELPFLADALRRMLEEYPSADGGLSRTERQILSAIDDGAKTRTEIFLASQSAETRPFMGDTTLWSRLDDLSAGSHPLVVREADPRAEPVYRLAGVGRAVLTGNADAIELNGIDRWFGGVHLNGSGPRWRWDGNGLIAIGHA